MGAFDQRLGVKNETTFNTPVVVDRFFEYNGDPVPVAPVAGRTEGNPMRTGSTFRTASRFVPYTDHAEGTVELDVMNKGFGFWLQHLLPSVATTGTNPYTHTATEGSDTSASIGKSFTAQFNAPFHPAGTNQSLTFSGGKVPKWTLGNDVDGMLTLSLDLWFASFTTATALATVSYPSSMSNFAWSHGVISIGGSAVDINSITVEVDRGFDLDRKKIRGNTAPKEPTPGQASGTFSVEADFESLTQFNRVHSSTVAGAVAAITGVWTSGTDVVSLTISAGRFDEFSFGGDRGGLTQELSGVVEYNLTDSPVTLALTNSDVTP
jgi:hypothetical protein